MAKRESRNAAQLTFNLPPELKEALEARATAEGLAAGSWVRKTIAPVLLGGVSTGGMTTAALPGAILGGVVGLLLGRLSLGNRADRQSSSPDDSLLEAIHESEFADLLGGDLDEIARLLANHRSAQKRETGE